MKNNSTLKTEETAFENQEILLTATENTSQKSNSSLSENTVYDYDNEGCFGEYDCAGM